MHYPANASLNSKLNLHCVSDSELTRSSRLSVQRDSRWLGAAWTPWLAWNPAFRTYCIEKSLSDLPKTHQHFAQSNTYALDPWTKCTKAPSHSTKSSKQVHVIMLLTKATLKSATLLNNTRKCSANLGPRSQHGL